MRQFLFVVLCLVASSDAEKIKLGDIETFHHGAGGEVFALDEKTLMIKDFTYDGRGNRGGENKVLKTHLTLMYSRP